jgi:integrase
MSTPEMPPIGVPLSPDVEYRGGKPKPYRARVRWIDPSTKKRRSKSESFTTVEAADAWIEKMQHAGHSGIDPATATKTLRDYGESVMPLAMRGLEPKTLDPYLLGWRKLAVPALGHLPVRIITPGAVDRTVHAWIARGVGRSMVKNTLAALVRVMEQAVRDGLIERNPARITGWQQQYRGAEDEVDDPRSLALPDWDTLTRLAAALVERSADDFAGWGEVVIFAACTAARIGEVSGVRVGDINRTEWLWKVRRQTTTSPGGLVDKGTKGKRARDVPLIEEVRDLVGRRLDIVGTSPTARLFTGPRGGRISTAVLRDATHWDEVVTKLGYEHLGRHGLRHTGLTWMADAGVPVHVLRVIAGHGSLTTTQRYLHPDKRAITDAGQSLSNHLNPARSPDGPQVEPAPHEPTQ